MIRATDMTGLSAASPWIGEATSRSDIRYRAAKSSRASAMSRASPGDPKGTMGPERDAQAGARLPDRLEPLGRLQRHDGRSDDRLPVLVHERVLQGDVLNQLVDGDRRLHSTHLPVSLARLQESKSISNALHVPSISDWKYGGSDGSRRVKQYQRFALPTRANGVH